MSAYPAALAPGTWDAKPADRTLVSSWSMASMQNYLDGMTRFETHRRAAWADTLYQRHAAELHAAGPVLLDATRRLHMDIVMALGWAEEHALTADRPVHAARLDGYVAFFGLRGWYRCESRKGKHTVQVNYLRTAAEGNAGRWFFHLPFGGHSDRTLVAIVDRDSGLTAASVYKSCAREWIGRMEAGLPVTGPACGKDKCPCTAVPASGGM